MPVSATQNPSLTATRLKSLAFEQKHVHSLSSYLEKNCSFSILDSVLKFTVDKETQWLHLAILATCLKLSTAIHFMVSNFCIGLEPLDL